jgi:transcriptional regulator with XRE-family HTH domain
METTPGKRILIWREFKGLTPAQMIKATGIKRSTLDSVEDPAGSKPSHDTLMKVVDAFPDLSARWLLTGKGEMLADGRTLTPASQLPPQVPSKLEPLTAPAGPGHLTDEELRRKMAVVAESAELREVKSERDHLREVNQSLLAIISRFSGATDAPAAAGGGKALASSDAASLYETVDDIAYDIAHVAYAAPGFKWGIHRKLA